MKLFMFFLLLTLTSIDKGARSLHLQIKDKKTNMLWQQCDHIGRFIAVWATLKAWFDNFMP